MSGYAPKFRQDGDDVLQIYAKTEKPVGSSSIYFDQSCRKPNRGRRNVWRAELCFNGLRIRKRSYSKVDLEEWIEKTRHHWLENFVSGAQKPTLLTLRNRFLTLKEKLARNAGGNTAEKLWAEKNASTHQPQSARTQIRVTEKESLQIQLADFFLSQNPACRLLVVWSLSRSLTTNVNQDLHNGIRMMICTWNSHFIYKSESILKKTDLKPNAASK